MERISVPISALVTTKNALTPKQGIVAFKQLVKDFQSGTAIEPITICKIQSGKYFIQNGVTRAKAALLAGKSEIVCNLYNDTSPAGNFWPIGAVKVHGYWD